MPSLFSIAAPAVLLVPAIGMGLSGELSASESAPIEGAEGNAGDQSEQRAASAQIKSRLSSQASSQAISQANSADPQTLTKASDPVRQFRQHAVWRQTRIEQRVIIRISPRRTSSSGGDLFSRLPRRSLNARYVERKTDKCVAVDKISGVQTGSGNRLLLFMRNQKIMSINLEKACRARDFYSGFYVEKNKDGKLCVKRDRLHSRNGVKCEVKRMRQLVAVTE